MPGYGFGYSPLVRRFSSSVAPSPYGTLTTAWIAATGETDLTILGALNTLESDMATYGLTSKMKALYPMVGGTAAKHKFNFMDARDLDAAFRLTFSGGWTHSSTGALPNGTNGYADTRLNINSVTSLNSIALGVYSRTNTSSGDKFYGVQDITLGTYNLFSEKISSNNVAALINENGFAGTFLANTDSRGFFQASRTASNAVRISKNTTQVTSTTASNFKANYNYFLGATNNTGAGASRYNDREIAFYYLSDGLTSTELTNFDTAVQTFQTTLGRQVGVPIVSDSDAQAFLNAAVITDTTQATAVNNLVIGLKADSLWTKMAAIYPMVGGTAASHKFNLKNPLDTDAAYRLVFNGGWTHSSTGALPNGTNAYADTKLNTSTVLSVSSSHISHYARTTPNGGVLMANDSLDCFLQLSGGLLYGSLATGTFSNTTQAANAAFYVVNRPNGTNQKLIRNSTILLNDSKTSTSFSNKNILLGAYNAGPAFPSNAEIALASVGTGLTDTEASNLYTRVQTYQTALSRNV